MYKGKTLVFELTRSLVFGPDLSQEPIPKGYFLSIEDPDKPWMVPSNLNRFEGNTLEELVDKLGDVSAVLKLEEKDRVVPGNAEFIPNYTSNTSIGREPVDVKTLAQFYHAYTKKFGK